MSSAPQPSSAPPSCSSAPYVPGVYSAGRALLLRDLAELMSGARGELDLSVLLANERPLRFCWTLERAPVAEDLLALRKLADVLQAGHVVNVVLDEHASDAQGAGGDWVAAAEPLVSRHLQRFLGAQEFEAARPRLLFHRSSAFRAAPAYLGELQRVAALVPHRHVRAVRNGDMLDREPASDVLRPLLRLVDEHALEVHVQLGAPHQWRLFAFLERSARKTGLARRLHMLHHGSNRAHGGLLAQIALDADAQSVGRAVHKARCGFQELKDNDVLSASCLLFSLLRADEPFLVARKPERGPELRFATCAELRGAFERGEIHPVDLKSSLLAHLQSQLAPAETPATVAP